MKLSVIILNYNVRYFLELCLKSVEAAIKNIEAEIIVVDNNSSDSSCEMVRNQFPIVNLIENKENFGFSKGNNIGATHAKGEYLCILNPDTVVAEDTFEQILKFAESKDNCGIVGCQLINGAGQFLLESKRNIPTPKIAFQKLIGITKDYYNNKIDRASNDKTDILVGAFMLIKQSVYEQVNGFDEDYFMYGEDIDLSYKVVKAGYTNYYFGEATAIHFKGESTLRNRIYVKRFYEAMAIFYKKHFSTNTLLNNLVKFGVWTVSKRYVKETNTQKLRIKNVKIVAETISDDILKTYKTAEIVDNIDLLKEIDHTLVIFDSDLVPYKEIINSITFHSGKNNSYRILLKNSNFIIGSDSSLSRGEVIHV